MLPTVRRTWGLRGRTPLLKHRMNHWGKVSAIGAVTISPKRRRLGLYLQLHPNAKISQQEAIGFLRALLRHLRGPVFLIWCQGTGKTGQLGTGENRPL